MDTRKDRQRKRQDTLTASLLPVKRYINNDKSNATVHANDTKERKEDTQHCQSERNVIHTFGRGDKEGERETNGGTWSTSKMADYSHWIGGVPVDVGKASRGGNFYTVSFQNDQKENMD
jgi:hypothetical protein